MASQPSSAPGEPPVGVGARPADEPAAPDAVVGPPPTPTAPVPPTRPVPGPPAPRWVGPLFFALAAVNIPWIVLLWLRLPSHDLSVHYRLTWVGFDVALALALARTGWAAWHGFDHVELPAVCAATLLAVDGWFDVLSSSSRSAAGLAIVSAVLVELPLAGLCVWIAVNAERVRRERLRWALGLDPIDRPR